jgi:hypothetical protein
MAKIETKVELLYDSRDNKWGRIVIEMTKQQVGNFYNLTITDYLETSTVTEIEGQEPIISKSLSFIRTKPYQKTVAEVDGLYNAVSGYVDSKLPFTEKQYQIENFALLVYVQNDWKKDREGNPVVGKTIYDLLPSDWQIKAE